MDDESTTRLVHLAYSLKELDISRSRWGCQITDHGLKQLSTAKCIGNLSSISMWGSTGITDKGVVQLTLLKSFHKGPPKVRTQISLAVAALAVHVPAEDWGDGGILNWIGDEMNSHPECIPSFLELLKILLEGSKEVQTKVQEEEQSFEHSVHFVKVESDGEGAVLKRVVVACRECSVKASALAMF